MFDIFTAPEAWIALFTLILLEVFVSIDNIVFISFASKKLAKETQKKAIYSGFALAILLRIILFISATLLLSLKKPFAIIDTDWLSGSLSIQGIILFTGGLFLVYKGTKEIREKIEDRRHDEREVKRESASSLTKVLIQILVINMVFSFDFVLSAIGMTHGITSDEYDALSIIILATLLSLFIMIAFAHKLNTLVEKHPSVKVLGLAFMILIGFVLLADAAHVSHITLFGSAPISLPKIYLYFVILFSAIIITIELHRNMKNITKESIQDNT